ncbi:MAG: cobalamin-dependent protein [Candidatus Adiutrix sp.]|jgi:methanogenic corrinoid protein MtbC1|nr:cobalamin-dependent protein [Candidatus Adiutrix sp.]
MKPSPQIQPPPGWGLEQENKPSPPGQGLKPENKPLKLDKLRKLIVALNEVGALREVSDLLHDGVSPHDILQCFQLSLAEIGEMYQRREYYVAGLILSGEIMRQSMRLLMPRLVREGGGGRSGLIILGTIEGDIHELGKNIASYFLEAYGFEVVDLGVDVPPRVFLKEILQREPDAVGVSLLLTSCLAPLKRLVHLVHETYHGRAAPPIFVGGFLAAGPGENSAALAEAARALGVDHIVRDAFETLNLCLQLVRDRSEESPKTEPGLEAAS